MRQLHAHLLFALGGRQPQADLKGWRSACVGEERDRRPPESIQGQGVAVAPLPRRSRVLGRPRYWALSMAIGTIGRGSASNQRCGGRGAPRLHSCDCGRRRDRSLQVRFSVLASCFGTGFRSWHLVLRHVFGPGVLFLDMFSVLVSCFGTRFRSWCLVFRHVFGTGVLFWDTFSVLVSCF
jgi:hypothetical protein